jgi:hypothetical protein
VFPISELLVIKKLIQKWILNNNQNKRLLNYLMLITLPCAKCMN